MELRVAHAVGDDPVDVRCLDRPAVAAHRREADVVEHDVDDVRRTVGRLRRLERRPVRLRIADVDVDRPLERRRAHHSPLVRQAASTVVDVHLSRPDRAPRREGFAEAPGGPFLAELPPTRGDDREGWPLPTASSTPATIDVIFRHFCGSSISAASKPHPGDQDEHESDLGGTHAGLTRETNQQVHVEILSHHLGGDGNWDDRWMSNSASSVMRETHHVSSAHGCARRCNPPPSRGHDGKKTTGNHRRRSDEPPPPQNEELAGDHGRDRDTARAGFERLGDASRRADPPRPRPYPSRPYLAGQWGDQTSLLTGVALNPISGLGPGAVDVS